MTQALHEPRCGAWSPPRTQHRLTSMSRRRATSSRMRPSRLAWAARLVNHTQGIQYLLKSEWRLSNFLHSSCVMKPAVGQRLSATAPVSVGESPFGDCPQWERRVFQVKLQPQTDSGQRGMGVFGGEHL